MLLWSPFVYQEYSQRTSRTFLLQGNVCCLISATPALNVPTIHCWRVSCYCSPARVVSSTGKHPIYICGANVGGAVEEEGGYMV